MEKIGVPRKTFYNRLNKLKDLGRVVKDSDGQGVRYWVAKCEPVSVPDQCQSNAMAPPEPV